MAPRPPVLPPLLPGPRSTRARDPGSMRSAEYLATVSVAGRACVFLHQTGSDGRGPRAGPGMAAPPPAEAAGRSRVTGAVHPQVDSHGLRFGGDIARVLRTGLGSRRGPAQGVRAEELLVCGEEWRLEVVQAAVRHGGRTDCAVLAAATGGQG